MGFTFNGHKAYAESDSDVNVFDRIDAYLSDAFSKAHFPAMSVTVVDKENVLLSKAYGSCESTDTPFLLGSVSKSFTALCIMQLVEQGKVDLDKNIVEYLPDATDGNKITVRQLLNHTSGLGEHQNLENNKIVGKQGEHTYANVNYSLLGKIIEAVSKQSYESYVTENVFTPLNMTNSAATLEKSIENGLIDGYENWFGVNTKTGAKYPQKPNDWITVPAGYLSASTADLGKYIQMYLNGGQGIVSSESIDKMFYENVSVDAAIPYKYGMGWTLINEPLKEPALRHSGLVETGMSVIYVLPESELGIAIAVNTNDYFVGKDLMDRIDWGVALMLMGDKPNQISSSEYVTRHLLYDFIYFVALVIAVLPLCLLRVYKNRLQVGNLPVKIVAIVSLHLLLPIFLLLLPQIAFSTPLWVVCAFVPDMFLTIIVSSTLLFVGGIIKAIFFITKYNKRKASF
ncbi:MAG: beta-lactamase family protein [Clostridiales bacterium]|nr:beta-lactamase family protein [Clostridiales bacterium]